MTATEYLLQDETPEDVSDDEIRQRNRILEFLRSVPDDAFTRLQYFQPQIGCFNRCAFCSQHAANVVWQLPRSSLRALIWAMRTTASERGIAIASERTHKPRVLFPYIDNDIGSYSELLDYVRLCSAELGCGVRITTVGFARSNPQLQQMHSALAELPVDALAGVRLSFTPWTWSYTAAAESRRPGARQEYLLDFANVLRTYTPRFTAAESVRERTCVELRFAPLVGRAEVIDEFVDGHHRIRCGPHLLVAVNPAPEAPSMTRITGLDSRCAPDGEPMAAGPVFDLPATEYWHAVVAPMTDVSNDDIERIGTRRRLCLLENVDGAYYAVDPGFDEDGFSGLNIYPESLTRKAGYNDMQRVFLTALLAVKKSAGIGRRAEWPDATAADVDAVLSEIRARADAWSARDPRKCEHIRTSVLPLVEDYWWALSTAGLPPSYFFSRNFTVDTGQIVNQGRANNLFRGLVSVPDEPVTPWEVRGNLVSNSKGDIWRICPVSTAPEPVVTAGVPATERLAGKNLVGGAAGIAVECLVPERISNIAKTGGRLARYTVEQVPVERVSLRAAEDRGLFPGSLTSAQSEPAGDPTLEIRHVGADVPFQPASTEWKERKSG
ncbi:hypothetical protein [Nocardia rhizosphaerae]|uniref:Radical SAM protein n=1 Tax=Nocardia rhizosphaerae TaxID=1691571 RepID=A0ABV8LB70_9NOCA